MEELGYTNTPSNLDAIFADGNQGSGPLDYLRIVTDTVQTAEEYRRMLQQCSVEYVEFARPPYGSDEAMGFRTTAVAFALIVALKRVKNCSF